MRRTTSAEFDFCRRRNRFLAERIERHARRQHQALLRAADRDVDAPFVMTIVGGGE